VPGERVLYGAWAWKEMEVAIGARDVPVRRSTGAGRYVCESTYWSLLASRQAYGFPRQAAFLHVPPVFEAMSLGSIASVVELVVRVRLAMANADRTLQSFSC
jgi:pyrrolidone-carboxylate peptidase